MNRIELALYHVDAFAERLFEGNPAAVVLLDDWLPDESMQAIAAELNLAETAFVRSAGNDWDLRWFAPLAEVDFCGHATVAAAHILFTEQERSGTVQFNTRVGPLTVAASGDGYSLGVPLLEPEATDLPPFLEGHFGNRSVQTFRNFENLFVRLPTEEDVREFKADLNLIAKLHPLGLAITAPGNTFDYVARYFAPSYGIPEDSVTGSIQATLAPFWADRLGKDRLTAAQCSQRGGRFICEIREGRVFMTGQAKTFSKASILF